MYKRTAAATETAAMQTTYIEDMKKLVLDHWIYAHGARTPKARIVT